MLSTNSQMQSTPNTYRIWCILQAQKHYKSVSVYRLHVCSIERWLLKMKQKELTTKKGKSNRNEMKVHFYARHRYQRYGYSTRISATNYKNNNNKWIL